MSGPSDHYDRTTLPSEYPAVPINEQPFADIETQYNKLVRGLVELWACINGANAGVDVNGDALQDYSASASLGILPRLSAIEDQGKLSDSSAVQVGSDLSAGDRAMRFILGADSVYKELQYSNSSSLFRLVDHNGSLQTLQGATPVNAADFATKQYVDGVITSNALQKYAVLAPPTWESTSSFSIDYGHAANSDGDIIMGHLSPITISTTTNGLNGLACSEQSLGLSGGTISVTSGSATVTGSGTAFKSDFIVGDFIGTAGGQGLRITAVTSDTSITVSSTFAATESGVGYYRGGFRETTTCGLNLYMVSDAVGGNVGYLLSTRNVLSGDTLVDLPKVQKTGSVSVTSGSKVITGSSTSFLTDFVVGQRIAVLNGSNISATYVASIQSDTQMTTTGNFSSTWSSSTIYVLLEKYRQLPFNPLFNSSGNMVKFRCTGFPWNTEIVFPEYDGSSVFVLVSGSTSTSSSSYDVWTNRRVPKQVGAVKFIVLCSFVNQTNLPSSFSIHGTSSMVSSGPYYVYPRTTTYNGVSSLTYGPGLLMAEVDLSSSGLIYYICGSTNASGSLVYNGWRYSLWKG